MYGNMKRALYFLSYLALGALLASFTAGCVGTGPPETSGLETTNSQVDIVLTPTSAPTVEALPDLQVAADAAIATPPAPTATSTPFATIPRQPIILSPSQDLPNIANLVEDVRDSVVSVVTEVIRTDYFGGSQRGFQSGSGVIFDNQGHILTNNHVIQGGSHVVVTLDDGRQLDATIVGADPQTDLAVLHVEEPDLPHISFAEPSSVRVGDWVIAIGNALALPGGPSVTLGIVSAKGRSFQADQNTTLYDLIQTDTIINPGNSGGPLINLSGQIVGINTAALRGEKIEGIGFAVGSETAILVSEELLESGEVKWPWLGVFISDLTAEQAAERGLPQEGILIGDIVRGGPAMTGGLRVGDVMISMSTTPLPSIRDLMHILRFTFTVGDKVDVEVWRDGERKTLKVILGEREPM